MTTYIAWIHPYTGANSTEEPIAVLAQTAADAVVQATLVSEQRTRAAGMPPGAVRQVTFLRPATDEEMARYSARYDMLQMLHHAAAWCGELGCTGGCKDANCYGRLEHLLDPRAWPPKSGIYPVSK